MLNIDVKLRYMPIVDFLRKNKLEGEKILEVGGGDIGISRFIEDKITICDIGFSENVHKNVYPVVGDARNLPFDDNSFEYVVSSDMLEHISKEDREKVVSEMIRVAKKFVLFGFPSGEKSHEYEKKIFNLGKRIFGREHKWLKEHVENGIPNDFEVSKYLKDKKHEVISNANLKLWFVNELFNPYLWFVPWVAYPAFKYFSNKGTSYRKVFIVFKEIDNKWEERKN